MTENQVISNMDMGKVPAQTQEVHYRVIAEKELALLEPIFRRLGWAPPDPDMCKVVIAEAGEGDDALILGFNVVQFVIHAEPMWLHPDVRGTGIAEGLVAHTQSYIENDCKVKRYLCIAKPGSFGARLAEKYGMVPYPGQVYVRQI